MSPGERQLAALAIAIIGGTRKLSPRERRIATPRLKVAAEVVETTRAHIVAGGDPLGDAFCALRSPEQRRVVGATYTPAIIIDAMLDWAAAEPEPPSRVVDAGAGSGRFIVAAARRFPKASLIAVETDPLATLMLRANAAAHGIADRLTVMLADYRKISLPQIDGRTLFIGNPPYVRHHEISETWKKWLAKTARRFDVTASKLAGLHIHFFVKTRELVRSGDFGTFITAAEWIDINYGSVLRRLLADGLGGTALHVIDPKARPFADALTTAAITCFRAGARPDALSIASADSLSDLKSLSHGRLVSWPDLERSPKWSTFLKPAKSHAEGSIELGELFRVHRGQVTGKNDVWIASPAAAELPTRFLFPTITKARELFAAGESLNSANHLRRVIDLPYDLDGLTAKERAPVDRFLRWARSQGAKDSFIAQHRRAWWSVGLREPAPILCTYMARRAPAFVRNVVQARNLNIAHGLYPREQISDDMLTMIVAYLRLSTTMSGGRTYAGGLVKFEPRELERIRIPALDRMHDIVDSLVSKAVGERRGNREGQISHGSSL